MPKISPCTRSELVRKLRRLGFEGPYPGGKHDYMKRKNFRLTIPNPHGNQIDSAFVKEILKQANISNEEWLKA
ncbi:MAG: type II toxin-antitoxin system HicA family toxin [Ignavibacteriales bacterium]|nr:type II toxin-antitoxin system HicA family toxin [Ignavibacteriales bacterium]